MKVGFSAFAPIVAPSKVPLGENQTAWQAYDSVALLETHRPNLPILIEQGDQDSFLSEQLKPEIFCETADKLGVAYQFNLREGHDHSYYFIASFIGEHIAFHAKHLH